MSYDISLKINTGKGLHTVVEVGNYTSNIRPMYDLAFDKPDWKFIHGMQAKDAAIFVLNAFLDMKYHPEKYTPLNPENGLGNVEGARTLLYVLYEACIDHPDTIVDIDS